ncbi:hypothetical protein HUJ04_000482 [Dendroctonus ponderosae]|nr:hypothetical protein HUJ04_000482 [Dendroctonus ponderosae]
MKDMEEDFGILEQQALRSTKDGRLVITTERQAGIVEKISSALQRKSEGAEDIKVVGDTGEPTISPKLFTLVLEELVKKLEWDIKHFNIDGTTLSHLWFVDDIGPISNNATELQEMIN